MDNEKLSSPPSPSKSSFFLAIQFGGLRMNELIYTCVQSLLIKTLKQHIFSFLSMPLQFINVYSSPSLLKLSNIA